MVPSQAFGRAPTAHNEDVGLYHVVGVSTRVVRDPGRENATIAVQALAHSRRRAVVPAWGGPDESLLSEGAPDPFCDQRGSPVDGHGFCLLRV